MNTITKYILNQVAAKQLSHEEAKSMLVELQSLEGSAEASGTNTSEVAIIGMAGRFPKALDLGEYWTHLTQGYNCIDHFPESRLEECRDQCAQSSYASLLMDFSPAEIDPAAKADNLYVKGGFLPEVDKFDAAFFRIPAREAIFMDPLQRVFLETAYEAMEDAGYGGKKLFGAKVGVFAGKDHTAPTMYRYFTESDPLHWTGSWTGILASRIAYLYNWRGPCMVIDTACSSGLVAIHEACRALQHHDCEMAVAGGIHLQLFPIKKGSTVVLEGVESSNGLVKTFDKEANGTVWGEGAGVVILKLLDKAVADGDQVQAVLKGSAINNDGASNGISAPNAEAQKEVILQAWKKAKIDPETISYIEAHGTGTNLGDPIEIKGLVSAFREYTAKKQFCGIGSVKTNVGHLVAASGLASVIKVVLALKNHQIPPSINFNTPNPYINFCDSPVYVNDRLRPWEPKRDTPRRAGVSSFGFSGTNCHLVLEEALCPTGGGTAPLLPGIMTLSAMSQTGLRVLLEKYHDFLGRATEAEMGNICYTANTGRGHYLFRLALVAPGLEDLKGKIGRLRRADFDSFRESGVYTGAGDELTETERRRLSSAAAQKVQEYFTLTRFPDGASLKLAGKFLELAGDPSELAGDLCRLYVQGADIDWDVIYRGLHFRKVSIPPYPLERIKFWAGPNRVLNESFSLLRQKPFHPLIHQLQFESFDSKAFSTIFRVKTHWVLEEHRLLGYYVLPGTAYLEMARVASEAYYEAGPVELRDLVLANPLVVDPTETKAVQTIIKKQADHLEFIVVSKMEPAGKLGDSDWVIHAQGKIYQAGPTAPKRHNPEELKHKLTSEISSKIFGANPSNAYGSYYGPRWRGLTETVAGQEEALLWLKLPEEFQSDLKDYYLHPALMDEAMNAFGREIQDEDYLPFIYHKFSVYNRTPADFYSYIRRKKPEAGNLGASAPALELITLDITLMDGSGLVFAEVEDYSLKKLVSDEVNATFQRQKGKKGHRKTGPDPATARTQPGVEGMTPRDEMEKTLALLWEEVLRVEGVGIHQNFFELGGDSLKAFQLIEKANQWNFHLSITDIYTTNTIAGMAALIREGQPEYRDGEASFGETTAEKTPLTEAPLIPVQSCFWERQFPEPHHWNLSVMSYSREGFDAEILGRVFTKIVEHHDALRMVFRSTGVGVIQSLRGLHEKLFDLEILDLTGLDDLRASAPMERQIELEAARMQGSMDLEKGPLVKVGLFKTDQGDHLFLAVHHLVLDGESLGILLEDLQTGYLQAMNGVKIQLPRKTSSFLEWARLLHDYGRSEGVLRELGYWRRIDETKVAPLPKDHWVDDHRFRWSQILTVQLSEEDSARLLKKRPYELSIREALLISFGLALQEWTGEEKQLVRVIGQGRDLGLGGLNLTRTIGWLSISYPVILAPIGTQAPGPAGDLGAQIQKMRDDIREVPGNGAGYDILRYITLPLTKELPPLTARTEIIFNFLGIIDGAGMAGDDSPAGRIEASKIPAGFAKSPESPKEYTLDVNVYIATGRLVASLDYNGLEYEEATIRQLGELFLGKVKEILRLSRKVQ